MTFLNPLFLTLGAAIAVPLILHLLQRHQGPRLIFPALRYLRRAEKENARRIKLRQLLLMALRLAVLILLTLAAARPLLRHGGIGHEPTAVAIILDNSLSSGAIVGKERILDQLKRRALETLAQARAEDRFWVIAAGSPWEPASMSDAATAADQISALEVSAGRAELDAALARARALLAAGAGERATEIHLLSDLQAASFATATEPGAESSADNPPVIVWGPRDAAPDNVGVTGITIAGGMAPRPGEETTLAVRVSGTSTRQEIPLRLSIFDQIVAVSTAQPNATTILQFHAPATGLVTGYVELDPDALRGDDRRYFVARVEPPPAVALAGEPAFIADALAVLEAAGRVRLTGVSAADLVIAPAGIGLGERRSGATAVVLAPTSSTELPAVNRRLADAGIPWRFGPPQGAGEARLAVDGLDDELLGPLADARLNEVYELRPMGGASGEIRLQTRDGRAWIVQGELPDGGGYLLVASPLSNAATSLPTSPAFLPLMDRLTGAWGTATPVRGSVLPGSTLELPVGATAVIHPDGRADTLLAGGEYRVPGHPGIYRVIADDEVIDAFAVNPDPAESDLTRLDDRALQSALRSWNPEWVKDPAAWSDAIFRHRLGRELWRPLVVAALIFLLVEGLVAASGRAGVAARDQRRVTGRAAGGNVPVAASAAGAGAVGADKRTS